VIQALNDLTDTVQPVAYASDDLDAALIAASSAFQTFEQLNQSSTQALAVSARKLEAKAIVTFLDWAAAKDVCTRLNYIRDGVAVLESLGNQTATLGKMVMSKVPKDKQDAINGGVQRVVEAIVDTITTLKGNSTLWDPCDEQSELCGFN
jgi:hypothetical protein